MDEIDISIINILKLNSRATVSEISKQVNLSIPAVAERIKKLEHSHIIDQYTIKVNRQDLTLMAFIFVSIDTSANIDIFRKQIIQMNHVLECHHIAGSYDYLLKVLVKDTNALEDFISHQLKQIKGVTTSNTYIRLSTLKEEINV